MQRAAADGTRYIAEARASQRSARRGATGRGTVGAIEEEPRRIGCAECFQPQVQIVALRKAYGLGQCRIQVEKVRATEIGAAHGIRGSRNRAAALTKCVVLGILPDGSYELRLTRF